MSVIFGIFNRKDGTVKESIFQPMYEALSYWEFDGSDSWTKGSVALGHLMLYNTPESKQECLPRVVCSEKNILAITIDVRLDNRRVLAERLEMSNQVLEKITDSEFVLAAYQKWGESCPKYLLGDFVFVIWDEKKQLLFCARDHIGIKPFYYILNDDLFVFSNDIRGLSLKSENDKKYNDRSVAMFLGGDFGFYDERATFFQEIRKLPAATSITITEDHVSESVYWDIQKITEIRYDSYEEYIEKFRVLLCDAVKVRLRTGYPVAAHLSGGLDSSAIAVLAARALAKRNQQLFAFNWAQTPAVAHDPELAEWGFATQLARLENIQQKRITLTAEFLSEMYDEIDISTDDISCFWGEYLVRDEVENLDGRTILSGWGGDELISYDGYAYFSGLFRQGVWRKAIKEISFLYEGQEYKWLRIIKRSLRELIYPFFYKRMSGLYKEGKSEFDSYEFTYGQFLLFTKEIFFEDVVFRPGAHNEQKMLFQEGHILQRIENWSSAAFGKKIEYCYPLLDKRIVEFALAVPEELYASKNGHRRHFFRKVISSFLPEHIAWEKKITESESCKVLEKIEHKALRIWLQKKEQIEENTNGYIDHLKLIKRVKTYFSNVEKQSADDLIKNGIVASILLSNLKIRTGSSKEQDLQSPNSSFGNKR